MKKKTIEQTFPDVIADVRYNHKKLWSKIDQSAGPDACWTSSSPKHVQGYNLVGGVRVGSDKRIMQTVHRLLLKIKMNSDLKGLDAVHTCGNMSCCNPAHLFAGTAKEIHEIRIKNNRNALGRELGTHLKRPRNQKYQFGLENIIAVRKGQMGYREFAVAANITTNRARKVCKEIENGTAYKWLQYIDKETK